MPIGMRRASGAQPELVASGRYIVVEAEGRIIGAGGWSDRRDGRAEVRHVAVDAAEAGRGVGRALMERVFDDARAAGRSALGCTATLNAVPFYERMGFAAHHRTAVPLGGGLTLPAMAMQRDL